MMPPAEGHSIDPVILYHDNLFLSATAGAPPHTLLPPLIVPRLSSLSDNINVTHQHTI